MRSATSLGDISNILSTLPTVAGSTRLAIFYSPTAIFNAKLSMANKKLSVLEAENTTLKNSVTLLFEKNTTLIAEAETLRTQAYGLVSSNTQLEREKETLIKELRAERAQGIARTRKAHELESAIKQRDAFVRAMIDINLHQHVLKNAYFSVETGCSVDEAIVSAITSAASNPASPWSRILAPPDITKSDLYKCAIELAAAARIRTDKSVQVARFWRHVAKCDPRNSDIVTPSPSRLDGVNKDLKKEERGNMLDDLLDRLRAGKDIRTKEEEERKPMLFELDIPENNLKSPASAFFEFYHAKTRAPIRSDLSSATLSSWNSNFTAPLASSELRGSFSICDIAKIPSNDLSSSLERICGVFSTSSIASSLNPSSALSASASEDFFPSVTYSLQPVTPFITGRGRSATMPFSARDLALLSVKNVASRKPTITSPGDKEQKAQALAGQRVRFNKQVPLARSRAIKASRPRVRGTGHIGSPSIKVKAGLLTPPAEADSVRYVRPPTVTRRKETSLPYIDGSPTAFPSHVSNRLSFNSVPFSPSQQKTKPYVIKDPSPRRPKLGLAISPPHQPLNIAANSGISSTPRKRASQNLAKRPDPASIPESNKKSTVPPKQRSSIPITSARLLSIPPQARTPIPTTPILSTFGIPMPTRTPPFVDNTCKGSYHTNPSTPTRPPAITKVMSTLKPVQPLHIVKKFEDKKPSVLAAGGALTISTLQSRHKRISPPLRISSNLPR